MGATRAELTSKYKLLRENLNGVWLSDLNWTLKTHPKTVRS